MYTYRDRAVTTNGSDALGDRRRGRSAGELHQGRHREHHPDLLHGQVHALVQQHRHIRVHGERTDVDQEPSGQHGEPSPGQ
ncbi:hypothetical protein Aple_008170 [Acrocarpospora pleiomorpha]|uniref:Uncharacterized protein n=1 Tax=Acrocarpospora pleiomorpha TaxID=90975 RepID=A0A5M3XB07_9ACTN|nr:hypothetical protein Aple_008170 [Acrocarpospora pleiomorpha]